MAFNPTVRKIFAGVLAVTLAVPPVSFASPLSVELLVQSRAARKLNQDHGLRQAAITIANEVSTDVDGYPLALAPLAGTGPSGGGLIPASSAAPKRDGHGASYGFCSWDNGTSTNATGRIPGILSIAAPVFAVVSPGLDNSFQTSCAQISSGQQALGDDTFIVYTAGQLMSGAQSNTFFAEPVSTQADLAALASGVRRDGQVRFVTGENALFRFSEASDSWVRISGAASGTSNWNDITDRPTTLSGFGITDGISASTSIFAGPGLTGGGLISEGVTLSLSDTGVAPGAYGDAFSIPQLTVDSAGRIVAAGTVAIDVPVRSVFGRTGDVSLTMSDIVGSLGFTPARSTSVILAGTGLVGGGDLSSDRVISLSDTGVSPGVYGSGLATPQITVDAQGRITAASAVALDISGALGYTPVNRAGDTMTGALSVPSLGIGTQNVSGRDMHFMGIIRGQAKSSTGISQVELFNETNGGQAQLVMRTYGSQHGGTLFGQTTSNWSAIYSAGADSNGIAIGNGLLIGTQTGRPVIFGTASEERMRITNDGNVGIGVTNPTDKLQVAGWIRSTGDNIGLRVRNNNNTGGGEFRANTGPAGGITISGDAGPINFTTNGNQRMLIDGAGNVGIGTTAPGNALSIQRGSSTSAYAEFIGNNGPATSLLVGQDDAGMSRIFQNGSRPITFWTNGAERVRMDDSGGVTIGSDNPNALLTLGGHIQLARSSSTSIYRSDSNGVLGIYGDNINNGANILLYGKDHSSLPSRLSLRVGTADSLTIDSNRNVGIGHANPVSSARLTIHGQNNAIALGRVSFNGSIAQIGSDANQGLYLRTNAYYDIATNQNKASFNAYSSEIALRADNGAITFSTTSSVQTPDAQLQGLTERLRIDSAGNIGIGKTNPGARLNIAGGNLLIDGPGNGIQLSNGQQFITTDTAGAAIIAGTSGVERLRVNADGAVSIGRASNPSGTLLLVVQNFGEGDPAQIGGEVARFQRNSSDNSAASISVISGSTGTSGINLGSSFGLQTRGRIEYDNSTSLLGFWNNSSRHLVINSSGNVGIGTSSPTARLHVVGSTTGDAIANVQNTNATGAGGFSAVDDAGIRFMTAGVLNTNSTLEPATYGAPGEAFLRASRNAPGMTLNAASETGYIRFRTGGGASSERMRITGSGLVGIGTTDPLLPLDVRGDVAIGNPSATSANLNIGINRTVDGSSFIDFQSEAGTNVDYNARVFRGVGANGSFDLRNTGSGSLNLIQEGSGVISLRASGQERFRIESSSAISYVPLSARSGIEIINTANNAIAGFVGTNVGAGLLSLRDSSGSQVIRADASNNTLWMGTGVAIGVDGQGQGSIQVSRSNGPSATFSRFSNNEFSASLQFIKSRGTVVDSKTAVLSGDLLGSIAFASANSSGYTPSAEIRAEASGNATVSSSPGRITFRTTPSGSLSTIERVRIDEAGRVFVNTTSTTDAYSDPQMLFVNGRIRANGLDQTSDSRLKSNIESIRAADMIDRFMAVGSYSYNFTGMDRKYYGYLAQELAIAFPHATSKDVNGYYTVDYSQMIPVVHSVVQEHQRNLQDIGLRLKFDSAGTTSLIGSGEVSVQLKSGESVLAQFLSNGNMVTSGSLIMNAAGAQLSMDGGRVKVGAANGTLNVDGEGRSSIALRSLASGSVNAIYGHLFGDENGIGLSDGQGKVLLAALTRDGRSQVKVNGDLVVGDGQQGLIQLGGASISADADGFVTIDARSGLRVFDPRTKAEVIALKSDGTVKAKRFLATDVVEANSSCEGSAGTVARDDMGNLMVCAH